MDELEQILDDCLEEIASGASSLEACLVRHPQEAAELEPLLRAAAGFGYEREAHPSPGYRARTRLELVQYMQAHPRGQRVKPRGPAFAFWQITLIVGALLIFLLASGTAYAQKAVPGDSLYGWKLTSERAWRAMSSDRVGIDLALAQRRMDEYLSVAGDPGRTERALQGYGQVLRRLRSETDNQTRGRIVPLLENHARSLKDSGANIPELDDLLWAQSGDTLSPASSPGGAAVNVAGRGSGAGSAHRPHPEHPRRPDHP